MRIRDTLYFAPGIKFSDVDVAGGNSLPDQLFDRINGYYLEPARRAAAEGYAFASGVLLVTCIDALSGFEYGRRGENGESNTNDRFPLWCKNNLDSFEDGYYNRFYRTFRNGLVHEARVKGGDEFNLSVEKAVAVREGLILSINPTYLAEEVDVALRRFIDDLKCDADARERLLNQIKNEFEHELES
jgi:hypothetical protein